VCIELAGPGTDRLFFPMNIKSKLIDPLFLVLISFAVFYGSLDIYFVSDNIGHIENAYQNLFDVSFYYFRPVAIFSLYLDKLIWGMNPAGYHFTNLVIHTLNTLLIYFLAKRFAENRFFALGAALLFLLHPIHSLPIFWISGRTDMICSVFYLLTLIFFVGYYRREVKRYQFLSVITFSLAMFTKEMAVSLPVIIITYVVLFDPSKTGERWLKSLKLSAPYLLILTFFLLLRFLFSEEVLYNKDHGAISLLQYLSAYLGLLIIPGGHIEIANYLKAYPVVFMMLAALALLGAAFLIYWVRKSKALLFFCLFLLLTLLPVTRLLMRWYLYIPSIGFCLALAFVLYRLNTSKFGKWNFAYLITALMVFVYVFFILEEQNRWINAGRLSKKISYQVARTISENNIEECFFFNVPAELEEVPVMLYGVSSFINFRLRNDFDDHREVQILAVCSMSLKQLQDFNQVIIGKMENRRYLISLERTGSSFVFPRHSEIAAKRVKIEEGLELEDTHFKTRIEKVNAQNEAKQLVVEIFEPEIPVLYYLNGEIYLDQQVVKD
jgi:hypothetical protein